MSENNQLKNSFCASPWLHMRINNAGHYEYCRWADKSNRNAGAHIRDTEPITFFQQHMQPIREKFVNGDMPDGCGDCSVMEQHNKVSGRQKQLLKVGVRLDRFEKTLASSPWVDTFTDTKCTQLPQDWQIDLGNYCNSACIFCSPASSSRVATEWKRLGLIDQLPKSNWTDDPTLVDKFIKTLEQSSHIQYLHFIGGETLITPAFKVILQALIRNGLHQKATIGFTTNLITWDNEVVELLTQFQGVHLGMSVEAFHVINDYVRWPAKLQNVQEILQRWTEISNRYNWLMQFRTTPTILTLGHLISVYDYAWDNNISIESCNFLDNPKFMRPSVMPIDYRVKIIKDMEKWIAQHVNNSDVIINVRNPNVARQQIVQDLQSYVSYLKNQPDESNRLPDLIKFFKKIEFNRKNSILTYLPEYEELFRSAGY